MKVAGFAEGPVCTCRFPGSACGGGHAVLHTTRFVLGRCIHLGVKWDCVALRVARAAVMIVCRSNDQALSEVQDR